ncbi:GerMN domain-containing protein [Micromonospora sp. NPDC050397]|uniref:GerMN domain-containing protein n=1 Tax=Micromonospora sp. NPDC050397 TaxID=3364279 RepID=UPI00384A9A59
MNEELLRQVLADEAGRVEVSPVALDSIRRRIRRRRWWWRRTRFASLDRLLVGAAVVVACAAVVSTCGPPVRPGPAPSPGAEPSSPGAEPSSAGPATAPVAVYYQGADPEHGLYREFRPLPVGDGSPADRVRAALRHLVESAGARDPDYRAGWPPGTRLRAVTVSAGTATVDLAGAAAPVPVSGSADDRVAAQAVQQLVWTATAVTGITGVRLLLDGVPVDRLWDRVDVREVLGRAPAVDVLAPVWLISPQQGDRVGRDLEVHVAGTVGPAGVHLRVLQGNRTVTERLLTLSAGSPAQGEARVRLSLPPGDYTLQAYAAAATGGGVRHLDDHEVTVG